MLHVIHLLLSGVMVSSGLGLQTRADGPPDTAVYAVSYIEAMASARARAIAALKQYRDASRKEDGYVRFDVLQHTMRANHFTVIETWRNQQALDAHVATAHTKQYRDELAPMTGSPLDERVYKAVE